MASLVNTTEEGYDILQERLLFFSFKVSDFGGFVKCVELLIQVYAWNEILSGSSKRRMLSGVSCCLLVDLSKKPIVVV